MRSSFKPVLHNKIWAVQWPKNLNLLLICNTGQHAQTSTKHSVKSKSTACQSSIKWKLLLSVTMANRQRPRDQNPGPSLVANRHQPLSLLCHIHEIQRCLDRVLRLMTTMRCRLVQVPWNLRNIQRESSQVVHLCSHKSFRKLKASQAGQIANSQWLVREPLEWRKGRVKLCQKSS